MKYCTNCLQVLQSICLVAGDELVTGGPRMYYCLTPGCVRLGLVTVEGYDRPERPAAEVKSE